MPASDESRLQAAFKALQQGNRSTPPGRILRYKLGLSEGQAARVIAALRKRRLIITRPRLGYMLLAKTWPEQRPFITNQEPKPIGALSPEAARRYAIGIAVIQLTDLPDGQRQLPLSQLARWLGIKADAVQELLETSPLFAIKDGTVSFDEDGLAESITSESLAKLANKCAALPNR